MNWGRVKAWLFWHLPHPVIFWVLTSGPGWLLCWFLADAWEQDERGTG